MIQFSAIHMSVKLNNVELKGVCHITGGGLIDNPPRVLPDNLTIAWKNWEMPPVFQAIQKAGGISEFEMKRTFNCCIGMLLIVDPMNMKKVIQLLDDEGVYLIGEIVSK